MKKLYHLPKANESNIIDVIRQTFNELSPKLKVVAQYVVVYPHDFALNSLNSVAMKLGIPQSTIVRLAKYFGFANGQEFQQTVRKSIISKYDYSDRIRYMDTMNKPSADKYPSFSGTLHDVIGENIKAMKQMESSVDGKQLDKIVDRMVSAESIFLVGVRRAFPLMLHMRYGLTHFHKKVSIIHGLGGMFREEAENISRNSLLFAISYYPYSPEPIEIIKTAVRERAETVLVTDSEMHPLYQTADEKVIIHDAEFYGVRTLSVSMNLVQAIVIAVGMRLS